MTPFLLIAKLPCKLCGETFEIPLVNDLRGRMTRKYCNGCDRNKRRRK